MHLVTQPVYVLLCSDSAMKGNNLMKRIPQYCCPNHWRTSHHSLLLEPGIKECRLASFGCSPNVILPDVLYSMKDDSSNNITYFQLSGIQVLGLWHYCLYIWALLLVIRALAIAVESIMNVDPCQTVSVEILEYNVQFCYAATFLWFFRAFLNIFNDLFLSVLIFARCSSMLKLSSHYLCMLT
jgi:hypothetical protein